MILTLLLGLSYREAEQTGFWGACGQVDPESLVTPWLVACWLTLVALGFKRAHAIMRRFYVLDHIRLTERSVPWDIMACYASALFPDT